ncbi:delta-60 repeat domain-containing protein [Chloracidobacterium aggregatum]|uniref:delta-60 repeat domain-containing protein n=1 Tax=Chloracidobacterium aggregatum TaxID=2851959 RepID=UPI001B8CD177|nr:delta-60 repeat domain-containing protein [Chloracidobacterium aggregatum]QUV96884.1 delta-60 repeat domain-containing protein [Chloracidobacterium sp. E]
MINKIGIQRTLQRIVARKGEIRAIAVQNLGINANKFIVAGNFEYRVPNTTTVYRHIMRLNPNGTIDTTFVPPPAFQGPTTGGNPDPGPINALAVDSFDRIVVGGEFTFPGFSRLLRLTATGPIDVGFTPPPITPITAAVLALEVDPANRVYVGLTGGGMIGTPPRMNFTRLLPSGALDTTGFWGPQTAPFFQASVGGPVRAIKYVTDTGLGNPGVVVGGAFTQSTGGLVNLNNTRNVTLFDLTGAADPAGLFFGNFFSGFDAPVNALAVNNTLAPSLIYAGGEFSNAFGFGGAPVPRARVAGFDGFLGVTGPVGSVSGASIPNPVRALVLTNGTGGTPPFTSGTALLHVGGQQTTTAFADVALNVTTGGVVAAGSLQTSSPLFPANPAVVRAMAANNPITGTGALFGGDLLNPNGEKLVATFNSSYNPPTPTGLPSLDLLANLTLQLGPTQFYASAIDRNTGDLYIGGDVGPDPGTDADPGLGNIAELYRITPCGDVQVVARFRNVAGYLVRNDIDNGAFVDPSEDINRTPNMGFRRVDQTDPASIRAIAIDPQGRIYVGGQFNQVAPGATSNFVPWNNLVRLMSNGNIDPLFQVGQDDPNPPPGYTSIRKGGPTGFGAPGVGFTTVDPERIQPLPVGTCGAPPVYPGTSNPSPVPGTGEKYNPNEGRVNAIVLQPDGKVLIGGEFKCYNEVPRGGIARLTSTGSLDPTFGDSSFSIPGVGDYLLCGNPGGAVVTSIARNATFQGVPLVAYNRARVNAILLQPDGKVVVGGLFARANNVDRYNIARFNSDGTLDTSFAQAGANFATGTSGFVPPNAFLPPQPTDPPTGPNQGATSNGRGGEVFALARQSLGSNAGKILIGGQFRSIVNPGGSSGTPTVCVAFTRLLGDNGRLDNTFLGGRRSQPPGQQPEYDIFGLRFPFGVNLDPLATVRTIVVKSDDRPIIGGPFLIGPRNLAGTDGIGYINNRTRARVHRTGVNGEFGDALNPFLPPPPAPPYNPSVPQATFLSTWLAVPPGVGQNPNAPLVFQPGPYAVALAAGFGGFPPPVLPLGSLASIFAPGSAFLGVGSGAPGTSEISYYPNLPFNQTPPFGLRYTDTRMTVNTITLDPDRRRAYIGGLFNTFESVRADFQNDGAGTPNGLNLDIRWPGVAALQNGSGCSYGLVQPSFPPSQPIPFPQIPPPGPPVPPPGPPPPPSPWVQ